MEPVVITDFLHVSREVDEPRIQVNGLGHSENLTSIFFKVYFYLLSLATNLIHTFQFRVNW
jgi:hypothetical protein